MPRWPDTQERDSQILTLDADTVSADEIAEAVGTSVATVRRVISAAHGRRQAGRRQGYTDPEVGRLRAEAIRLQGRGRSVAEIAALISRSERSVSAYLRREEKKDLIE